MNAVILSLVLSVLLTVNFLLLHCCDCNLLITVSPFV
uniref:Uncharacterized protein n=1 Tax=Rhizophora mucronata TaxID=61149 RepID=A0A2P2M9D7_RHIMU